MPGHSTAKYLYSGYVVALLALVSACGTGAGDYEKMICTLDKARGELEQFSLDVITGELKTGLEGVCCDRAFSMTAIEVERDGSSFVAAYESTFYGFVPEKWIDRLKIDTNRQSPDNRFILVSDKEDWSDAGNVWEGNCSYE